MNLIRHLQTSVRKKFRHLDDNSAKQSESIDTRSDRRKNRRQHLGSLRPNGSEAIDAAAGIRAEQFRDEHVALGSVNVCHFYYSRIHFRTSMDYPTASQSPLRS